MLFIFAVIGIGVGWWIVYGKATNRAVEIVDGAPPLDKGGWIEKWALRLVPAVREIRRKDQEAARLKKLADGGADPWLRARGANISKSMHEAINKRAGDPPAPMKSASGRASADAWLFGSAGGWARFEYVDADGVITDRNIASWHEDGPYIHGYDLDRQASRTFRKDRISDFICE